MKVLFTKSIELDNATAIIDLINDASGDAAVENIYVGVEDLEDSTSLVVSGQIIDGADYVDLAIINTNDMTTADEITADGLYAFDASGLSGIKLTATGECTVILKALA